MKDERTTKYVTGTFKLTFHGNYIDACDVGAYFLGWVDGGLEDRDNLRSWEFTVVEIDERTGDPEGFDN